MNRNVKFALYGAGGLLGFTLAYVTFALMLGAQPHQIPIAGALFPTPPETPEQELVARAETPRVETVEHEAPRRASAGLLDVFQVQSPYSASELEALVAELRRKGKELDQRLEQLTERERLAGERSEFLDEQYAELQKLRGGLEEWQDELERRQAEVESSERARGEREDASWAKLAKLFSAGDAAEQGKRLAEFAPKDAARILHALKPARAEELLNSIGADRWREFADAYRLLEPAAGN